MIQDLVNLFMVKKPELENELRKGYIKNYKQLVTLVVRVLDEYLDPEKITEVDYGDYQGMLVYIIGGTGYESSEHFT